MRKQEAAKLVGKPVRAHTALNGTYEGVMEELLTTRPWRAKVRITGVAGPAACTWDRAGNQRWGYRVGEVIEVGGANVEPIEEATDRTYLDALEAQLANWEARVETVGPKDKALANMMVRELAKLIEQEPERLAKKRAPAPVAEARDRNDLTLDEDDLAKVAEEGVPTTMNLTRNGIVPVTVKVTALVKDGNVVAAYTKGPFGPIALTTDELATLEA